MAQLIYSMITSLDGYGAAEGWPGLWGVESPEYLGWLGEQPEHTVLMGATTYQLMSRLAANGEEGIDALTQQSKVVFSSTVDKVDWNTRLATGDAVPEITSLKGEEGEPMRVAGATLAGAAMRAGLVDEYTIVTHPVLVGAGTPFFSALDRWVNLDLVETRTFPGGVVLARYQTRR